MNIGELSCRYSGLHVFMRILETSGYIFENIRLELSPTYTLPELDDPSSSIVSIDGIGSKDGHLGSKDSSGISCKMLAHLLISLIPNWKQHNVFIEDLQ